MVRRFLTALPLALLLVAAGPEVGRPAFAVDAPGGEQGPPGLELYGIVIVEPGGRYAFIHDGSTGSQVKKITEGQTIAGALVKAILPDQVTFVYSGSEFNLLLRAHKASVPVPGLLNENQQPGGAASEPSPQPPQLTDAMNSPVKRRQLFPERGPSSDPPWRPPVARAQDQGGGPTSGRAPTPASANGSGLNGR